LINEELAVLAQKGDQAAMLQLWNQVQRFVKMKALRRLPKGGNTSRVELDDLMQAGYLATVGAVKDYDSASGYTFLTFLANHLKTAFAVALGIRTSRRDAILQAVSLDAPLSSSNQDGDKLTIEDTLEAPDAEAAFENVLDWMEAQHVHAVIMEQMKNIDERQADVIRKHYLCGLTLPQVAVQTNYPLKNVQQQKNAGIRQLRRLPAIRKLKQELYADENTDFYLRIGVTSFQSGSGSAVELLAERRDVLFHNWHEDKT